MTPVEQAIAKRAKNECIMIILAKLFELRKEWEYIESGAHAIDNCLHVIESIRLENNDKDAT